MISFEAKIYTVKPFPIHVEILQSEKLYGGYGVGAHLFPSRTEQLSPTAPMVSPLKGVRVGRRRFLERSVPVWGRTFFFAPDTTLLYPYTPTKKYWIVIPW